jgi:hypothetical protein
MQSLSVMGGEQDLKMTQAGSVRVSHPTCTGGLLIRRTLLNPFNFPPSIVLRWMFEREQSLVHVCSSFRSEKSLALNLATSAICVATTVAFAVGYRVEKNLVMKRCPRVPRI